MQKVQLVRYKSGKHQFEVACKPGTVLQYRAQKIGFDKVLESDVVRAAPCAQNEFASEKLLFLLALFS